MSIEQINIAVAAYFGLTTAELLGRRRFPHFARARQMTMYLARKHTKRSFAEIGDFFDRDHSTIVSGVQVMAACVARDTAMADHVRMIEFHLVEKEAAVTA